MKKFLIAALAALALIGCGGTHAPKPVAPVPVAATPAPALQPDKPLAVLGVYECGEMMGIIVVTADGTIVPLQDTDPKDLDALAAHVGPHSAGIVRLNSRCQPTQGT